MRITSKAAPKPEEMPANREHWSTAPALVRARITDQLSQANAGKVSPAVAVQTCFTAGYDLQLDEIPQPLTRALASTTDLAERSELARKFGSMQVFAEQQAVTIWHNHAEWRTRTLASEQAQKVSAIDTAKRDAAVRQRAQEILAKQQAEALANALKQAEKEIA